MNLGWERGRDQLALVRALLPDAQNLGGADEGTVAHAEAVLARVAPATLGPWALAHTGLGCLALAQTGRHLKDLPAARVQALVDGWTQNPALANVLHSLSSVYKIAHFDRLDIRGALRRPHDPIVPESPLRWRRNALWAYDVEEELECDVVVVGTGAGGAVVGRELAALGHAVVFVEEGKLVQRGEFPGHFVGSLTHLYQTSITLGNSPVLIPRGRLVGGSTAVNGASTFRPPRWVTQRWRLEMGSSEFSMEGLLPYFRKVEDFLQVAPASAQAAGPFHEVFSQGCAQLGWHHELMRRNAPGCTGVGFCDNGCRSGARRSTEVSYVPDALGRGAVLLTGFAAQEVLIKKGRACGIRGVARSEEGKLRSVQVRARAVVLACGALATPSLLLRQGLLKNSGQVGRNLTIHPSGASLGLFKRELDVARYIPQAEFSSQFLHEGILIVSAQPEEHMLPAMLPLHGSHLMNVVDERRRVAGLGFLITDCARGRVRRLPGGKTVVTYRLSRPDVKRLKRGHALLSELFLASGAQAVFPGLTTPVRIKGKSDLEAFQRARFGAGQYVLTAFHPLGTCLMAPRPSDGVVDLNHEAHGLPSLFIVDGSVVSGPLGVNPQLTIMALAARAAERIHERLAATD